MMIIQLDQLTGHEVYRQYSLAPHDFPEASAWEESGDFKLNSPVTVELNLNRIGGMIEVKGRVATKVESSCGRCLNSFSIDLDESFVLTFTNEPFTIHDEGADDEEGLELTAEELGLIPFAGESIDLTAAIGEQLFLALPLRPLCSAECRGLCPYCGIDLNEKKCECTPPDFNNKFSALKNVKIA